LVSKSIAPGIKKIITHSVDDEKFKTQYEGTAVRDQSTFVLKANFHLINVILMSLCSVFSKPVSDSTRVHKVSLSRFGEEHASMCIYDAGSNSHVEVIEYEPEIFKELR
jgi:hypothetical protein